MNGEGQEKFEVELIATPALPQNYAFRLRRMACWMHLYDFNEALRKRNGVLASTHFSDWKSCVNDFYEGKVPAMVLQLESCFGDSKKVTAEIPRVLPREVKAVPPGASTPATRAPIPGGN
jgi:hypothetical protein